MIYYKRLEREGGQPVEWGTTVEIGKKGVCIKDQNDRKLNFHKAISYTKTSRNTVVTLHYMLCFKCLYVCMFVYKPF